MDHVRRSLNSGHMRSGEWYSVYKLAEELEISRSPVREGLLRLEEAGLIKFRKNRGFQVVDTRPEDVAEIFALRLQIEPPAAFRAAVHRTSHDLKQADSLVVQMRALAEDNGDPDDFFRADRALHSLILKMGHSVRGDSLVRRLRDHTRILGHSTAGTSRTLTDILAEHEPILDGIKSGNAAHAREAMFQHISTTGKLLLSQAMKTSETPPSDREATVETIWLRFTEGVTI